MPGGSQERADQVVITNLALGQSPKDAARAVGVGRSTVYRQLGDLEFRQQVIERRAILRDELTDRVWARRLAMDSC